MKICHCITRMIVGGAQENTLLSAAGQLDRGHEVVLLTGGDTGREGSLLEKTQIPSGCRIVVMPEIVREVSPLKDWKSYCRMRDFFRTEKFDVVHTHSSKAGITGRFAAASAGVPAVVHTVHGLAFGNFEKPHRNLLYKMLERAAAKRCDRIFAVAQSMTDQCVAAGIAPEEKFKVVYSGMDTEAFANAVPPPGLREKLGLPDDGAPVIAALARLSPQKGYEFIMPLAEKLLKKHAEAHFLIIGDGAMRPELEARVKASGVEKNFHFAGLIRPDEVPGYLALSDMLWHLSLHEGLPRSVVQSLACGKPAVGFALDGTPEVIFEGKSGFLATPENPEKVLEATEKLIADPDLRRKMGNYGQQLVTERFAWRKMADTLLEEYGKILAEKNCGKKTA